MKVWKGLAVVAFVGVFCSAVSASMVGEMIYKVTGQSKGNTKTHVHMVFSNRFPIVSNSGDSFTFRPGIVTLSGGIMTGDTEGREWQISVKPASSNPLTFSPTRPPAPSKRDRSNKYQNFSFFARGFGIVTPDYSLEMNTPGTYWVYFYSYKLDKPNPFEKMFGKKDRILDVAQGMYIIEIAHPEIQTLVPPVQAVQTGCGTVFVNGRGNVILEVSSSSGVVCKEFTVNNGRLRIGNLPAPSQVRAKLDGVWSNSQNLGIDQTIEFGSSCGGGERAQYPPSSSQFGNEIWWKRSLTSKDMAWLREQRRQGVDDLSLQFASQMLARGIIHPEGSLREAVSRKTTVHVETQIVGWVDKFTNELVDRKLAQLRAEFQQWTQQRGVSQEEVSWGTPVVQVRCETKYVSTSVVGKSLEGASSVTVKKQGLLSLPLAVVLAGLLTDGPIASASSKSDAIATGTGTATVTVMTN